MEIFHAAVLGILQGLTEFLPVSSSAHLSLAPWLFGWEDPGLAFDVALHLGTLVAVLWYFRKEWLALAGASVEILTTRRLDSPEKRQVLYLVIATIPGGIAGLFLNKLAEETFRAPALTATALIVMGTLLWWVDRQAAETRTLESVKWQDALIVGCAQMFALIPGVSRSGSTITAGRFLKLDRQSAAVFSFLMSMPITAAAAIVKVPHALREHGPSAALAVGVLTATVSSALAINVLLRYVSKHSYGVFAAYRWVLALVVYLVVFLRG
ncbi:MAG: undecaprenyl-diphosphatase UppP [Gemmatimonadetes bacterium]|nr:undecaprenyl-diphosphatase UppP [Gemmatimonadota bacterium]